MPGYNPPWMSGVNKGPASTGISDYQRRLDLERMKKTQALRPQIQTQQWQPPNTQADLAGAKEQLAFSQADLAKRYGQANAEIKSAQIGGGQRVCPTCGRPMPGGEAEQEKSYEGSQPQATGLGFQTVG